MEKSEINWMLALSGRFDNREGRSTSLLELTLGAIQLGERIHAGQTTLVMYQPSDCEPAYVDFALVERNDGVVFPKRVTIAFPDPIIGCLTFEHSTRKGVASNPVERQAVGAYWCDYMDEPDLTSYDITAPQDAIRAGKQLAEWVSSKYEELNRWATNREGICVPTS